MKNLAIILARGGSRRIPRKNLVDFCGKPMLAWSIEACIESNQFSRVLVSTDDAEIAEVAIGYGASVPFLRDAAFDDYSSSAEASLAALRQAQNFWGEEYDVVTQLMANCPLRNTIDIVNAVEQFYMSGSEFQISCSKFGWMNPWWAAKLGPKGQPQFVFVDGPSKRSQDLPELFCPTGAIWIAKAPRLVETRSFYTSDTTFYPMNWYRAIDIDDFDDLFMAKVAYRILSENCG